MRSSIFLPVIASLASSVLGDLHNAGICVNKVGGQSVYAKDATLQACSSYLNRNTGSKQWDTCPDCQTVDKQGMTYCASNDWHIGGDELNYYCKQAGASDSLAN
ncbi:hypothetical protein K469DRAFT_697661 [Zopfia rhizophila CBS 207.26]|uniref:Cyanovirin-N domain-containing protein n=1 Tax=Zopfia rhizophila CBS 207.26 TaxID=1314779 RepID=A0A6A6EEC5_9PEZI|nr:hypothetical protein K469DRAFT_697661 [Zopfia rhizophila CBS 207.26]